MTIIIILLVVLLSLPPVWSRVDYHSREAYRIVKYWLKPPSEAVFVPSTHGDGPEVSISSTSISSNPPAYQLSIEPTAILTQNIAFATFVLPLTDLPTQTPTPFSTPIPLPTSVLLTGIRCERQLMNNCGPATLSMYLSFYSWGKDQLITAAVLRPNSKDANVMPYELVDFVTGHTELHALWRYGGDLQTIKALLAAGFPVMIEKSFEPYTLRHEGWMGHYNLVVGYDDDKQSLTVHDSYLLSHTPWGGEIPLELMNTFIGFDFSYKELEIAWRSFNYVFIVVFPPERRNEVLKLIGPLANEAEACRRSYDYAMQETSSLTEVRDQFFAWFNAGTSLVCLQEYNKAATAFDTAFNLYPDIEEASRPYRLLWYEIDPYPAYYYSARYQDVIDLADQTLEHMAEPVLEESYYWRALSYYALGNTPRALTDLRTSLEYHPGFAPSVSTLEQLERAP